MDACMVNGEVEHYEMSTQCMMAKVLPPRHHVKLNWWFDQETCIATLARSGHNIKHEEVWIILCRALQVTIGRGAEASQEHDRNW
jgi:hypothetical protein